MNNIEWLNDSRLEMFQERKFYLGLECMDGEIEKEKGGEKSAVKLEVEVGSEQSGLKNRIWTSSSLDKICSMAEVGYIYSARTFFTYYCTNIIVWCFIAV